MCVLNSVQTVTPTSLNHNLYKMFTSHTVCLQAPPPMPTSVKNTPQALSVKTEGARRLTQKNYEHEYQQALFTIKEKIQENEGPDIKETMMDQIRQWFIECRSVF